MTKVSFDEARRDVSLRQKYLNGRNASTRLVYLDSTEPVRDWLKERRNSGRLLGNESSLLFSASASIYYSYAFTLRISDEIGQGYRNPIFVCHQGFDSLTEAGLSNGLLHETVHVDDCAFGIPLNDGSVLRGEDLRDVSNPQHYIGYMEMRAFEKQIDDDLNKGLPLFAGKNILGNRQIREQALEQVRKFWEVHDKTKATPIEKRLAESATAIEQRLAILCASPYKLIREVA